MSPLGKFRSKIIDSEDPKESGLISQIKSRNPDKKVVFATGCYDLVHAGHVIFFEQLKQIGDIVVIGLGRDSTIKLLKREPIRDQMDRAYLLAGLSDIDYVILDNNELNEGKIEFMGVIKALMPDVFVLNSDDSAMAIKKELCSKLGIQFVTVDRIAPEFIHQTSTTKLIERIKNGRY